MVIPETNHILVVDDEESIRFFLSEELMVEGYKVDTAANGAEALTFLQQQPVSLAIVDYQMPGLTGLELMNAMQTLPDVPELIMLTAHATLETSIAAMRLGSCDFLLKPYIFEDLLRGVKIALQRRQQKVQQKLAVELLTSSLGLQPLNTAVLSSLSSSMRLSYEDVVLLVDDMILQKDKENISLTLTEFRLLAAMMKQPHHPFTFQELAYITHDRHFEPTQARDLLKSHLGRLRKKLGKQYIINLRGVGYRFV